MKLVILKFVICFIALFYLLCSTRTWDNPLDPNYIGDYSFKISPTSIPDTVCMFKSYTIDCTTGTDTFALVTTANQSKILEKNIWDGKNKNIHITFIDTLNDSLRISATTPNGRKFYSSKKIVVVNPFKITVENAVYLDSVKFNLSLDPSWAKVFSADTMDSIVWADNGKLDSVSFIETNKAYVSDTNIINIRVLYKRTGFNDFYMAGQTSIIPFIDKPKLIVTSSINSKIGQVKIPVSFSDSLFNVDTIYYKIGQGSDTGMKVTGSAFDTITFQQNTVGAFSIAIWIINSRHLSSDKSIITLSTFLPDTTLNDHIPPVLTLINPSKDTIIGSDSNIVSVKCTDVSGIASVIYSIGSQQFTATRSTPSDSIFTGMVKGLAPGAYSTVTITATDASSAHNVATATVKIKYDNDKTGPIIKRFDPAADSQSISASSYAIKVVCKDTSGVASVVFGLGTASFPATKSSDSIWSATVTNLTSGAISKIIVTATDASINANTSVMALSMKYDPTMNDNIPPIITLISPSKDTTISSDSSVVWVKCTDASGVAAVAYAFGTQTFTATRPGPTDSLFSATVKGLSAGAFSTITITATDASTARNTATTTIKIKYDNDNIKPVVSLFDPAKDSISINANSYAVKVISKDSSGVASVLYTFGTTSFPATKTSDSVWSGTVSGLVSGALNKITVVATDASVNANKDTMSFFIKYDPTMTDLTGPVFFPKNGPANNAFVADSTVNITDSIFDPSGVDSVYWTQNGKNPKSLTLVAGTTYLYTLADTLHRYHLDTIVVYAQDKSTKRNKSSQTIILNYNVPPVINDTAVSTNRNVAKTWTLNALSVDGDPLTWTRLTSPSALSGAVTGTLPSVTFTPVVNWSGVDSFKVQVTDGHWSDTAKIKITVVNVNVAPSIITPPSSATKNVGQSVTFSVSINADVNPAPSYVWNHNGNIIASATTSSYSIGSIALTDSGSYTVTVANSAGTITSQPVILTVNYAPIITKQPQSQTLYLNQPDTFSVVANGKPMPTYTWKKNGVAISGQTGSSLIIASPGVSDSGKYTVTITNNTGSAISDTAKFYAGIMNISAGGHHTLILKTDGTLWGCGDNSYGQLGDGTTISRTSPVQISSMTNVQSVAAGSDYSLILKRDGILWACGNNGSGQLGDGTNINRSAPIQIMSINNIKSIAAGGDFCLVIKADGTLWAWGSNFAGQLGDGTTTDRSLPVQDTSIHNAQGIAAGTYHSLILKTDGTLWTCGWNTYGQLGDGTNTDHYFPMQVPGISNVQSVAAGSSHSLILLKSGALWACGYNFYGQLGDGTTIDHSSPVQITSIDGVQAISAGGNQSLILKSDNTLWATGSNIFGITTSNNSPVQVMNNVQNMSAGGAFCMMLKVDGTLAACGDNSSGQLGDGTTINHPNPISLSFK